MPLTKVNGQMLDGAITADSSGNVGIGTSSPSGRLDVRTAATTSATVARFSRSDALVSADIYYDGSDGCMSFGTTTNHPIAFDTNNAERMRITSGGDVLVGVSIVGLANGGIQSRPNGNATNVPFFGCAGNSSSSSYISYGLYSTSLSQYQFYVDYNGTISARSTSITGLSDISEKENIKPLETGLNEVLALQPRRFDWKKGSGQNIAGFVAQEVETVLPDLVADYKVNETTTKKGLKMGDMIPTLVKAIQEQQAMIEELKQEVAALKASH